MLQKILASVGIGSAKVDAILDQQDIILGEGGKITGHVLVEGGDVEQDVDKIILKLKTKAKTKIGDSESYLDFTLSEIQANQPFKIKPGEKKRFGFSFPIHSEMPVTILPGGRNLSHVWIETSLDIAMAIDPKDRDYLDVEPNSVVRHFFKAMEECGYTLAKSDVEKGFLRTSNFQSRSGCYQEMEYRPKDNRARYREVELSFVVDAHKTHCLIEVDRLFLGDGYTSLSLPNTASFQEVLSALRNRI